MVFPHGLHRSCFLLRSPCPFGPLFRFPPCSLTSTLHPLSPLPCSNLVSALYLPALPPWLPHLLTLHRFTLQLLLHQLRCGSLRAKTPPPCRCLFNMNTF